MTSRLLVLTAAACLLAPSLAAQASSARVIQCGTDSRQRVRCDAGGQVIKVKLVRDVSNRCGAAGSWGWTESFVWADNGCRGDFEVSHRTLPVSGRTRRITCGTLTTSQSKCSTEGLAAGVKLIQKAMFARCTEGTNWGYSDTVIWAGRGCRAEFEVTYRDTATPLPAPAPATKVITCGSTSGRLDTCKTDGTPASVRLVRDLSGTRCRRGTNWGNTDSFIWANQGCRAEFEVTHRGGASPQPTPAPTPPPATRVISCGNASGSAMSCNAFGTVATVSLKRDRSAGRCGQSSSWGVDEESIWVARGCYGDFAVTYGVGMRQF